ncbi:DUF2249 domain-containing protein [Panacibacter ginsenosidivorans]|uniref:DUF2249 domain-containing protein n=1 Tax=Panacibacter ginsenosidivorans TaxID=1813871 RepID=A0A5B8VFA1_9BACT|nr:DUF2249 domain-containing protein [Panacibacter ginsenosidivorans]QEC69206.1 DUF2249 domain-containing protein [Panacibacter ginsenosidivorans]
MIINDNTKIAAILKHNPDALEAIISISPKFTKLRNPVLRRLMAGRTTVSMASKIGGCDPADFFIKLQPLGFEIDDTVTGVNEEQKEVPEFISSLKTGDIVVLDVRPIIASGKDPLRIILEKISKVQQNQALKIINSFEPTPLMLLLGKQGFQSYVNLIDEDLVETYFYRAAETKQSEPLQVAVGSKNWEEMMEEFHDKMQTIDVRALEMPQPMLTILDSLEKLPEEKALYVYHKRIPVFLLPELRQRKFDYRIKEVAGNDVHLLIFKTQ